MSTDRLRELFLGEAVPRVQRMTTRLLALESQLADGDDDSQREHLDAIYREAHSLKGSAAMVGLPTIGDVAHAMEEVLETLVQGLRPVSPSLVDELLSRVDAIQGAIDAATTSRPTAAEPAAVVSPAEAPAVLQEPVSPAGPVHLPVGVDRVDEMVRLSGVVRSGLVRLRTALTASGVDTDQLPMMTELEQTAARLQRHATAARTMAVGELGPQLQRAVRDAARARGVEVRWTVTGGHVEVDRAIVDRIRDSLVHMVRNSVAHGIEPPAVRTAAGKDATGHVRLQAESRSGRVLLTISDDGSGLDREALEAAARARGVVIDEDRGWTSTMFSPGLSTATDVDQLAGRGVGMAVVAEAVGACRGRITVETTTGSGTSITLDLPTSLAVARCIEVEAAGGRYAIPLSAVRAVMDGRTGTRAVEGRATVDLEGRQVPVLDLGRLLDDQPVGDGPLVVLSTPTTAVALRVHGLVRHGEITIQSTGVGMPRNDLVLGTSVASDGSALVVLDPAGLAAVQADDDATVTADVLQPDVARATHVLVVDDAVTVRELQRTILQRAGYRVSTAQDGRAALALLDGGDVDLVVTDVEMPRMDGYALTESIRARTDLSRTPVLLLTTLDTPAAMARGLDAGADGYLLKAEFSAESFLAAVAAQVGPA